MDRWTILKTNKSGQFVVRAKPRAGLIALHAFEVACDRGAPGIYELRADDLILATAEVQKDEFNAKWFSPFIFFALGRSGLLDGLDHVAAFLDRARDC